MLLNAMEKGDTEEAIDVLKTFFARIPYCIQKPDEKYYQLMVYTLFTVLRVQVLAEVCTNSGRIDAVVELNERIYILEFKFNSSAKEALEQSREKEYYQRYRHCGKKLHLLGINVSKRKRQIADWQEAIDN